MKLTEEQQAKVQEWAQQGDSLKEIQKKLEETFGIGITYMEARLLVAELDVSLKDPDRADDLVTKANDLGGEASGGEEDAAAGGVSVTLDNIAQPDAMVSGKVRFSDGESASWAVDMTGRLSLDAETPGYRPSEDDLMAFQSELQNAVRQAGL